MDTLEHCNIGADGRTLHDEVQQTEAYQAFTDHPPVFTDRQLALLPPFEAHFDNALTDDQPDFHAIISLREDGENELFLGAGKQPANRIDYGNLYRAYLQLVSLYAIVGTDRMRVSLMACKGEEEVVDTIELALQDIPTAQHAIPKKLGMSSCNGFFFVWLHDDKNSNEIFGQQSLHIVVSMQQPIPGKFRNTHRNDKSPQTSRARARSPVTHEIGFRFHVEIARDNAAGSLCWMHAKTCYLSREESKHEEGPIVAEREDCVGRASFAIASKLPSPTGKSASKSGNARAKSASKKRKPKEHAEFANPVATPAKRASPVPRTNTPLNSVVPQTPDCSGTAYFFAQEQEMFDKTMRKPLVAQELEMPGKTMRKPLVPRTNSIETLEFARAVVARERNQELD
eukprot:SAG31_NODE_1329_length_8753_cov_4.101225_1_plen_398_part_10